MDKENITEVGKDSEKGKYSVWEASVDEDVQIFFRIWRNNHAVFYRR